MLWGHVLSRAEDGPVRSPVPYPTIRDDEAGAAELAPAVQEHHAARPAQPSNSGQWETAFVCATHVYCIEENVNHATMVRIGFSLLMGGYGGEGTRGEEY